MQEENKQQRVNWNYKNYFLTYPHTKELSRWAMGCHLNRIFGEYGIRRWAVCRERHQDGHWHMHAIYCLVTKLHTRDVRKFDLGNFHPHVKSAGTPDDVFAYITKEDTNWIGDWKGIDLPTDYRKRKADKDAFELDREIARFESPFPFELPNEQLVSGMPDDKRRHYWFKSRPDWGKTTWINDTFSGKRLFLVPAGNKYRWEGYRGEEVCVWDDHFPTREDIVSCGTVWRVLAQVPGDTRYSRVYWPRNKSRIMIVLHNDLPSYVDDEWFRARFFVYDLNTYQFI